MAHWYGSEDIRKLRDFVWSDSPQDERGRDHAGCSRQPRWMAACSGLSANRLTRSAGVKRYLVDRCGDPLLGASCSISTRVCID